MKAHSENAMALAHWLQQQAQVSKVNYAGLTDHPSHELAKKQQSAFGGVLSFEVAGGQEAAWQLIDGTRMISITANLGDTKTTITHPATTTHSRLSPEDRVKAGISDGLVRIAVGLESIEDIQKDIALGLASIK
jgi:O-succinylhomoserine sulfhydrylase